MTRNRMEKQSSQVPEMWKRNNKLAGPMDTRTVSGPFRGSSCFLYCFLIIPLLCSAVLAGPVDDLTMGEAFYMSGNLAEAAQRLSSAARSETPTQAQRALYLLGRIS